MVDGEALNFMKTLDVASLFETAWTMPSNTSEKEAVEKRYIFLKVFQKGSFVSVRIENYCSHFPELSPEGLPVASSKKDAAFHGYGTKKHAVHCGKIQRKPPNFRGGKPVCCKHAVSHRAIFLKFNS